MKSIATVLTIICMTLICPAGELPKWIENSCKADNMDQFVEWMKDSELLYNIRQITSKEIVIESGHISQEVTLLFDDSKKCMHRQMVTVCTPIGLDIGHPALVVSSILSDCDGNIIIVKKTIPR